MPAAQPLTSTYLPLPALRAVIDGLGIEHFPFLNTCEDLAGNTRDDWTCLTRMGVGLDLDLSFYKEVFLCFTDKVGNPEEDEEYAANFFQIYQKLSEHCITAEDSASMKYVVLVVGHLRT